MKMFAVFICEREREVLIFLILGIPSELEVMNMLMGFSLDEQDGPSNAWQREISM